MTDVRAGLERIMRATLADQAARHDWTYRAVRPMPVPPQWKPGQSVVGDCSKGVQYVCRWVPGVPDPMGQNWGPYGNSATICARLRHLASPAELQVGDLITFGPDGDEHATMVLEAGADPLLWSFGHQGAPNMYRLSQDGREHQLLRLPVPAYVPAKADELRAKVGYWAWLQWRLGEGDWHGYRPTDRNVRPHVPRVIPAQWWRRYLRFLANRRKGNKAGTS